jgi:hypothetical protein
MGLKVFHRGSVTAIAPLDHRSWKLQISFPDRSALELPVCTLRVPTGQEIVPGTGIELTGEDYQETFGFASAYGWSLARRDLRRKTETWRDIPAVYDLRFGPLPRNFKRDPS